MDTQKERSILWDQLVYGKLVKSIGGPIVSGRDHGVIGLSTHFPRDLKEICHTKLFDLGNYPREIKGSWINFPWKEEGGGILWSSVLSDVGVPYIVVAFLGKRDEAGDHGTGRLYNHKHFAVTPAMTWKPESLLTLKSALNSEPMTSEETDMPRLISDVPDEGDILPEKWLDEITPLLKVVMSGKSLSIQTWEISISDILRKLVWMLCAMPKALAWRIPCGAGLISSNEFLFINYTQFATSGIRSINDSLSNSDGVDFSAGVAYVEWLEKYCADCKTTAELSKNVNDVLSGASSFESLPPDASKGHAIRWVNRLIWNDTNLEKWQMWVANPELEHPPLQELKPSSKFLNVLISAISKPAVLRLLPEVADKSWEEAWMVLCSDEESGEYGKTYLRRGLAQLIGMTNIIDPKIFKHVSNIELKGNLKEQALMRLSQETKKSNSGEPWVPLWTATEKSSWVVDWQRDNEILLVRLALLDELHEKNSDLRVLLNSTATMMFIRNIEDGQFPGQDSLESFLETFKEPDLAVLKSLVRKAQKRNILVAYSIWEYCQNNGFKFEFTTPVEDPLSDSQPFDTPQPSDFLRLADALVIEKSFKPSADLILGISKVWNKVSVETAKQLGNRIHQPLSYLLVGYDKRNIAQKDLAFEQAAEEALNRELEAGNVDVGQRLIDLWCGRPRTPSAQLDSSGNLLPKIRSWLHNCKPPEKGDKTCLGLIVKILKKLPIDTYPELTGEDPIKIGNLLHILPLEPRYDDRINKSKCNEEILFWVKLAGYQERITLGVRPFELIIEEIVKSKKSSKSWQSEIQRKGWGHIDQWRIIWRFAQYHCGARFTETGSWSELKKLEQQLLGRMSLKNILIFPFLGIELSKAQCNSIARNFPQSFREIDSKLIPALIECANRVRSADLLSEIARWGLWLLANESKNESQILKAIEESNFYGNRPSRLRTNISKFNPFSNEIGGSLNRPEKTVDIVAACGITSREVKRYLEQLREKKRTRL